MVNVDALKGKPIPRSWDDLLKPEYKGLIGYLDPASAFVGYVGAVAVNQREAARSGILGPAIACPGPAEERAHRAQADLVSRVPSGEIAILLDYDFNAYRARYKDKANVAFVIPAEGTVVVPYVMSLLANGPNAANGRKVLDFVLSDEGQAPWAEAFLRRGAGIGDLQGGAGAFLPAADYARATPVDYGRMAEVQKGFSEAYLREVR
jgi:putative spermidine/putrescine transport system substrate-binding protein